jgi:hypothetical protein
MYVKQELVKKISNHSLAANFSPAPYLKKMLAFGNSGN